MSEQSTGPDGRHLIEAPALMARDLSFYWGRSGQRLPRRCHKNRQFECSKIGQGAFAGSGAVGRSGYMVGVSSSELGLIVRGAHAAGPAAPPRSHSPHPASRFLAMTMAGLSLASCSSVSTPSYFDAFKSKPTTTLLLIESNPAGAQAQTSFGKTCRTPCTMLIGEAGDFTVTFTLAGYVAQTLTVHAKMSSGGLTTSPSPVFDPPSLFPTLEKETPPAVARKPAKPRA
jgi:hypothetical protein